MLTVPNNIKEALDKMTEAAADLQGRELFSVISGLIGMAAARTERDADRRVADHCLNSVQFVAECFKEVKSDAGQS